MKSVEQRFLEKVLHQGECWTWTGSTSRGTPTLSVRGKPKYAARVSWDLYRTSEAMDGPVGRSCGHRLCVRPDHLTIVKLGSRTADLAESFWEKVEKRQGDACWVWLSARDPNGYGRLTVFDAAKGGYRPRLAHRVAFSLTRGDPGDLCVLHKCDNPPCVRPDHLFLGTRADNMADCVQKGRAVGNRGKLSAEKHPMAKLNWEVVRAMRASDDTQYELARRYGVHQTLVSLIQRRKIWIEKER